MEHSNSKIEEYIAEAEEKYDIKLEKGDFYGRKFKSLEHFQNFCGLVNKGNTREFLWTLGTLLGSCVGFLGLASFIPYHAESLLGVLEFYATGYTTFIGAITISDRLVPLYEKKSKEIFNKDYKDDCEKNQIPNDI